MSCSAEREISISALFFLIAFSFAAASAKEKADVGLIFALAVDGTLILSCRGRRHRRPAKKLKDTFLILALLSDQEEGSGWRSHL